MPGAPVSRSGGTTSSSKNTCAVAVPTVGTGDDCGGHLIEPALRIGSASSMVLCPASFAQPCVTG